MRSTKTTDDTLPVTSVPSGGCREVLQSKPMTYAELDVTEAQYNILLRLKRGAQSFLVRRMTGEAAPGGLFPDDVQVVLNVRDFPELSRNLNKFAQMVEETKKISFSFSWVYRADNPVLKFLTESSAKTSRRLFRDGERIHTSANLVSLTQWGEESGTLVVLLNKAACPFLLYIGEGFGGTRFDVDVALSLRGLFAKRVYEMICDWCTYTDVKKISIADLRRWLGLSDDYENKNIRRKVLDKAKSEIDGSDSWVKFDYSLEYSPEFGPCGPGKRKANCIVFNLIKSKGSEKRTDPVKFLRLVFEEVCDPEKKHLCRDLAERAAAYGKEPFIRTKYMYYSKRRRERKINDEKFRNTMLKIVRDSTGVDLRSERHVRNSAIRERRLLSSPPAPAFGDPPSGTPAEEPTLFDL